MPFYDDWFPPSLYPAEDLCLNRPLLWEIKPEMCCLPRTLPPSVAAAELSPKATLAPTTLHPPSPQKAKLKAPDRRVRHPPPKKRKLEATLSDNYRRLEYFSLYASNRNLACCARDQSSAGAWVLDFPTDEPWYRYSSRFRRRLPSAPVGTQPTLWPFQTEAYAGTSWFNEMVSHAQGLSLPPSQRGVVVQTTGLVDGGQVAYLDTRDVVSVKRFFVLGQLQSASLWLGMRLLSSPRRNTSSHPPGRILVVADSHHLNLRPDDILGRIPLGESGVVHELRHGDRNLKSLLDTYQLREPDPRYPWACLPGTIICVEEYMPIDGSAIPAPVLLSAIVPLYLTAPPEHVFRLHDTQ